MTVRPSLRHDTSPANPLLSGLHPSVTRAIGFGVSQSGRFLRDFLYLGFNQDMSGRTVFDGLMPHVGGTRRMATNVRFDADFVSTLDFSSGYQVFLTPSGDNRGLYVASKYQAGFVVRESEGGRSTITFDYRVVGHPVGSTDARLPEVHLTGPDASSKGRVPQQ